ncbi:gliding motility lipoprotein GldD [Flavobacterium jejuense]|uniref:Gliding motility lipoprotein GldD n=1 Tax=Flavobacterium jejuense TaxID=1544455 RepID=A0ABX0ISY2_9FLAO|nr:gliding motility lipoprotein GldD [Flavobacterium jejuense]NHN26661.1 gliding motility lipoprotein GldD [Flavobacterium jejuense]
MKYIIPTIILSFLLASCGEDSIPKPKGQLRLEYPEPTYGLLKGNCSYSFDVNDVVKVKSNNVCSFELHYPKMKATIYLTYKPVDNNIEDLLKDAQKLTYDHVIKADDILEQPFMNSDKKVYGMFYEVGGNAATNAQFYVTDSTKNFVVGSLYFYAKPNYDSILPAASYLKNDIRKIMETIEWK